MTAIDQIKQDERSRRRSNAVLIRRGRAHRILQAIGNAAASEVDIGGGRHVGWVEYHARIALPGHRTIWARVDAEGDVSFLVFRGVWPFNDTPGHRTFASALLAAERRGWFAAARDEDRGAS